MENQFTCYLCEKLLSKKSNLYRHLREVHGVEPDMNVNIRCSQFDCEEMFGNYDKLRCHIADMHGIIPEHQNLKFSTEKEFHDWKEEIEQKSRCFYVHSSSKILSSNGKAHYYNCHRTGIYQSKSTGKRLLKSVGSKKIDSHCPSTMEVKVSENDVTVHFYPTHTHDSDLAHVSIYPQEKRKIVDKIQEGVTLERLMEDARKSSKDFTRTQLLTRKDLHNIKRDFGIVSNDRFHASDAVSVQLWVNFMRELKDDSPVLFYKEQRITDPSGQLKTDDFCLTLMTPFQKKMLLEFGNDKICIDSTHGTNPYDFHLTTLLTVDEFGSGCPVAFHISNQIDKNALKVFFGNVQNAVGEIRTNIFMSDDAPAFYNAWESVMGSPNHRLLCTWHVDRSWQRNLSKIKGGKKSLVYKTLRVLLQEPNKEKFNQMLQGFINLLGSDSDTEYFQKYFCENYADRVNMWAFCHRVHLGINTNMYLESLHKTIKHVYLEGKQVRRLDKTLNALMKLSRDKIFERLIKIVKKAPTARILKIKSSHHRSENIFCEMIESIDANNWKVRSECAAYMYSVKKLPLLACSGTKCGLVCSECNICVHAYECTCVDNLIKFNICKHIHAIAKTNNVTHKTLENKGQNSTDLEVAELFVLSQDQSTFCADTKTHNSSKLKLKLKLIEDLLNKHEYKNETYQKTHNMLDKCIQHLENDNSEASCSSEQESKKIKINPSSTSTVPPNKRIQPQQRKFKSTKRKNIKSSSSISKPTHNEILSIIQNLKTPSEELLNVHSEFDHSYFKP